MSLRQNELAGIYEKIATHFNESELRDLCFQLAIDYEDLPGATKRDRIREIVEYCERRGSLPQLRELCSRLRPHVDWYEAQPSDNTLEILPDNALGSQTAQPQPKYYREFFGRDSLLDEIIAVLDNTHDTIMVAIDGMGGIGKTALAQEIASRCLQNNMFEVVVWEQAPKSQLVLNKESETLPFNLVTILDAIGRRLGALDIIRLKSLEEKKARLSNLLQETRVLLILDNLETITHQNEIVESLYSFLVRGKVVLTSRKRFGGDVYPIHLTGLDQKSALQLIQNEAQHKRLPKINNAPHKDLVKIVRTTGGSPLALKLIVGQLGRLPLDVVLNQLRKVKLPEESASENEYSRFYKRIFLPSWNLISDSAKKLLIAMTLFDPNVGGKYEALKAISNLEESDLVRQIDELWSLSFLEIGESSGLQHVRYYLHPLTQNFLLSEFVKGANQPHG